MITKAVVMSNPGKLAIESVELKECQTEDVVVDIHYSGISTGTEKLFWNGKMPAFPGMGYPLVPGYESTGEVVQASKSSGFKEGDIVFSNFGMRDYFVCNSNDLKKIEPMNIPIQTLSLIHI